MKTRFRTAYQADYDSSLFVTDVIDDGVTHQSFKDECDINNILVSWLNNGVASVNGLTPSYLDLSTSEDYKTSVDILIAAQASFDALPSKIRSHFHNDPIELLDFVHNPNTTKQQLADFGLIEQHDIITSSVPPAKLDQLPT